MRIAVNHLTRMQSGFMCVAGVDGKTGKHVRPVTGGRIPVSQLSRYGGPFDIAHIVELGRAKPVGEQPETEDHQVKLKRSRFVEMLDEDRFWMMLRRLSHDRLSTIFGAALTPRGRSSAGVDPGQGSASLGVLSLDETPELYVRKRPDRTDQIRMRLTDGQFDLDLGVTDIRLYGNDHQTPDRDIVARVRKSLSAADEIFVSVGLTRPFYPAMDRPACHWLQVNNVHLENNPCWQLG